MCSHSWNKLIAVSCALAAAGILACAGALLDVFMPRGSLLGFLTWMVVLGIIVREPWSATPGSATSAKVTSTGDSTDSLTGASRIAEIR